MATFENLAGLETTFEDFGLQTNNTVDLGDSLLIIGTSEDGPLYQPVSVDSVDDAIAKFGSITRGSLVRGIFEAMNASNRAKDIRGMRIGTAVKAKLELEEASVAGSATTSIDNATTDPDTDSGYIEDALTLEAKQEGELGNSISVWLDILDSQQVVAVYNPYTDITSTFTFSLDSDADVTVHGVKELVDAINSDSNLEDYLVASMKDLEAILEINLNDEPYPEPYSSGVVIQSDGTVYVTLSERLDTDIVGTNSSSLPSGVHDVTIHGSLVANVPTAGNKLLDLREAYIIEQNVDASGNFTQELLDSKGMDVVELNYVPLGKNDDSYNAFGGQSLISLDGNTLTTSSCKQVVVNGLVGQSLDGVETTFTTSAWASPFWNSFELKKTLGQSTTTIAASSYLAEWIDNVGTAFSLTNPAAGGVKGADADLKITFRAGSIPEINSIITASYWSEEITLTEYATSAEVDDRALWTDYFVAGKTLQFGAAAPEDIVVTYRHKKALTPGGDIKLVDAETGKLMFPGGGPRSPKKAIEDGPVSVAGADQGQEYTGAILGLRYTYEPEWVPITSAAKALVGGTDGVSMSVAEAYDSLETAYEALENYPVDLIVLKDLYLDATKTDYNSNTGLLETVSAGFAPQFCTFLDDHAKNTGETIGVMAVTPATSNKLADINTWYRRLTEIDTSDPTRAANIMAGINCKWLQVTAAEPIYTNASLSFPYIGTMESAYAGMIQGLTAKSTLSSTVVGAFTTTNKPLSGIIGTRYVLSSSQLDKLTQMRYVTLRNRPGIGLVITDGVTAAAEGSDYRRLSTIRIVKQAMEVVRDVAEPFIGEPNTAEQRDALDTAVTKGLQAMIEAQALRDATFNVESTVAEQVQGIVRVEMILVPAFEMRRIKVTVKLRATL